MAMSGLPLVPWRPTGVCRPHISPRSRPILRRSRRKRDLVTTEWLLLHNGKADEVAREAVQHHPALLRKFIDVMAGRGKLYIRFLQELAKLYVRVARAVEHAYSTVVGATEAPLPPSLAVGGWPGPRW